MPKPLVIPKWGYFKPSKGAHRGLKRYLKYVAFREKRDADLAMPRLILPSIQVNIRAGRLPEPESNGTAYLRIPLDFDCHGA